MSGARPRPENASAAREALRRAAYGERRLPRADDGARARAGGSSGLAGSSSSFSDHLDEDLARAGAVELAEEDPLPGPEHQGALDDRDGLGRGGEQSGAQVKIAAVVIELAGLGGRELVAPLPVHSVAVL